MRSRLITILVTAFTVFAAGAGDLNQRPIWPSAVYGSMLVDQSRYGMVTSGLVGWWPFEEGSGSTTADASGNGQSGTLNNMEAGDWVAGLGDGTYALDFDGTNESVSVASTAALTDIFSGGGTITARFVMDSLGGANQGRILQKGPSTSQALVVQVLTDGVGGYKLRLYRLFSSTAGFWDTPNASISAGTPYALTITYDDTSTSNNPAIWLNGVSQSLDEGSTPVGSATSDTGAPLYIGNRDTSNRGWDGRLDDLRFYDRVLTADEIAAIAAGRG